MQARRAPPSVAPRVLVVAAGSRAVLRGPIGAPPFPGGHALRRGRPHRRDRRSQAHGLPRPTGPTRLGAGERAMVTAMRAPVGDFRDWPAVDSWAAAIAAAIRAPVPAGQA